MHYEITYDERHRQRELIRKLKKIPFSKLYMSTTRNTMRMILRILYPHQIYISDNYAFRGMSKRRMLTQVYMYFVLHDHDHAMKHTVQVDYDYTLSAIKLSRMGFDTRSGAQDTIVTIKKPTPGEVIAMITELGLELDITRHKKEDE